MPDSGKFATNEEGNNIKVCVRCRPFNQQEKDKRTTLCIAMPTSASVIITDLAGGSKSFDVDRAYWSHKASDPDFANQEVLQEEIGVELQENALKGYNVCLFAYGQTGSGKTYSVLGAMDPPEQRGLLPRIIEATFSQMAVHQENGVTYSSSVTYIEIYNEVLKDLLNPKGDSKLDVRSNPKLGVYIHGLKDVPVFDKDGVQKLLEFGAKARTVGATCMNDQSSRSHCIFSVEIISKQAKSGGGSTQRRAKLNLVDLAGSERQAKTQASGERLKEGSSINKSLSNLAMVISKLAEQCADGHKKKKNADFVPFRNSKLTYCLQDSLSGNSKTVMIAALSPAQCNYEETLSTLRFAQSVKSIKTKAVKNEMDEGHLVNNLKAECERLRQLMAEGKGDSSELEHMKAMAEKYGEGFEDKLEKAKQLEQQRQEFLEDAGLTLTEMAQSVGLKEGTPQLVNICTDPSLSGCLVYFLVEGTDITCGSASDSKIVLSGLGMAPLMAVITNTDNTNVKITCQDGGRVLVNGTKVPDGGSTDLRHGDRLILGYSFCFRVVLPNCQEGQQDQAKDTASLEKALNEVVPDQGEAYQQCKVYVEDLKSRVGATRAQLFLFRFQSAMQLVEEANVISRHIRPLDRFKFHVEVMVDTFHYQMDEPECVIRLNKNLTGIRRMKDLIWRHIIEKKRKEKGVGLAALLSGLVKASKGGKTSEISGANAISAEPFETVGVWELEAFKIRMIYIREAYEFFQQNSKNDFSKAENDPWRVIEPWQVMPMLHERGFEQVGADPSSPRDPLSPKSGRKKDPWKDAPGSSQQSCNKCGAFFLDDAIFCQQCGARIGTTIRLEDQLREEQEAHGRTQKELSDHKFDLSQRDRELQSHRQNYEQRDRERVRYEDERHAYQEERLSWETNDRARSAQISEQDTRIRDLERQLERQRAETTEAREQLRAALSTHLRGKIDPSMRAVNDTIGPALNAPAEARLRHASEESAVAAHLATKLLGNLRAIKGDLRTQMAQKESAISSSTRGMNFYRKD